MWRSTMRASGKIDVQGWVTLTNSSGDHLRERPDSAGGRHAQPGRRGAGAGRPSGMAPQPRPTLQQAGTESGSRERLGDFYLYPLAERTTIANHADQAGQLSRRPRRAGRTRLRVSQPLAGQPPRQPQSAKSVYRFSTGAHAGLGDQLPAGMLRFYLRDKRGDPQFIGESRIDHTPMGSTLSLATGDAFDVKVRAVVDKRTKLGTSNWQTDMRYELSNALPRAGDGQIAAGTACGATRASLPKARRARGAAPKRPSGRCRCRRTAGPCSPPASTHGIRPTRRCARGARRGCSCRLRGLQALGRSDRLAPRRRGEDGRRRRRSFL